MTLRSRAGTNLKRVWGPFLFWQIFLLGLSTVCLGKGTLGVGTLDLHEVRGICATRLLEHVTYGEKIGQLVINMDLASGFPYPEIRAIAGSVSAALPQELRDADNNPLVDANGNLIVFDYRKNWYRDAAKAYKAILKLAEFEYRKGNADHARTLFEIVKLGPRFIDYAYKKAHQRAPDGRTMSRMPKDEIAGEPVVLLDGTPYPNVWGRAQWDTLGWNAWMNAQIALSVLEGKLPREWLPDEYLHQWILPQVEIFTQAIIKNFGKPKEPGEREEPFKLGFSWWESRYARSHYANLVVMGVGLAASWKLYGRLGGLYRDKIPELKKTAKLIGDRSKIHWNAREGWIEAALGWDNQDKPFGLDFEVLGATELLREFPEATQYFYEPSDFRVLSTVYQWENWFNDHFEINHYNRRTVNIKGKDHVIKADALGNAVEIYTGRFPDDDYDGIAKAPGRRGGIWPMSSFNNGKFNLHQAMEFKQRGQISINKYSFGYFARALVRIKDDAIIPVYRLDLELRDLSAKLQREGRSAEESTERAGLEALRARYENEAQEVINKINAHFNRISTEKSGDSVVWVTPDDPLFNDLIRGLYRRGVVLGTSILRLKPGLDLNEQLDPKTGRTQPSAANLAWNHAEAIEWTIAAEEAEEALREVLLHSN